MTAPVTTARADGVLIVRLANAARRNAVDMEMARALYQAVSGDLSDVGAIALLADGDHFCVGGDVRAMAAADDRPGFVRELAGELHRSMRVLQTAPPVVVGVRGWAAGAGMSLVCAGDVVVAGESASFQPAYPGIGVTPDGGMSWNLPRAIGERAARSLILRNVAVTAARARELGLVDEVVADDAVETTVLDVAGTLACGPRAAQAAAKRLVLDSASRSYAEQLDAEADSIAFHAGTPDGVEGITAFVERRAPRFAGSGRPSAR